MVTEFCLGVFLSIAIQMLIESNSWLEPGLMVNYAIFLTILVAYHKGESIFVLFYHTDEYGWSSYMIYHSREYMITTCVSQLEFWLEFQFLDFIKVSYNIWFILSFTPLAVFGLVLRNLAFHHAKSNFHHLIRYGRDQTHELVTTGIYSWERHPSYVGYFVMAVSLQILLKNPVSSIVFFVVLRKFFTDRIGSEEETLFYFFGDNYLEYTQKVSSRIHWLG